MTLNFILGQLFGFIALFFMIISFQCTDKNKLLKNQIFGYISFTLQYAFLGAISGCLMSIVSCLRNIIFKNYNNKKAPIWVLIFIIFLVTFLSLFGYKGVISLLPTLAILGYTFSIWTGEIRLIRIMQAYSAVLFLIYDLCSMAIMSAVCNFTLFISVLISIYKLDIKGRKNEKN